MKQFCKRVLPVLFCFALLLSGFCTLSAAAYGSDAVIVGEGKTSIGPQDMNNCKNATKIVVADGVTEIQDEAFYYSDVKTVSLPASLKSIGKRAFYKCSNLTKITIPENVSSIGEFAFLYCDNLTTVYFNAIDCNNGKILNAGWSNYLKNLVIGLKVKTIPQNAFSYCSKLETVVIPSNVKTIEKSAFEYCGALKSVTLEEGLERIENNAFYGCKALTEITIPNSVTHIGSLAFALCDEDMKINIEDENLLEPDDRNFGLSTDALIALIVLLTVPVLVALAMNIIYLVGCVKITKVYCRKKQKSAGGLTVLAVIASLLGFGFWYLLIFAILNHGEKEKAV